MKVAIKTYGCQMNERDSEMIGALMRGRGYAVTARESEADVLIVNTCSVREKAELKALGKLGLSAASKRARPGLIVGAAGCMVQRMGHDILRRVKGLDFAVGTHRLWKTPDVVDAVRNGLGPVVDVSGEDNRSPEVLGSGNETGVSVFVNILFGCDRRCSYCVVPDVRGPEWSRPAADIIDESRRAVRAGAREIKLLGQSVMSYGRGNPVWRDNSGSRAGFSEPLPRLLEALDRIEGLERIRFTSAHPSGCTEEMARAIAELPTVCEHVHLPVQSGSDRILELMNRGYSTADFRASIGRLRSAVPGISLSTDVIAGFPGETPDEFEATRDFMDEMMFDDAFIFKYNARPGTPASGLADDVSEEEKLRRNHVLLRDQDKRSLRLNAEWIGREVEVLAEGPSKRNELRGSGRTRTNRIVVFDAYAPPPPGCLAMVEIGRVGPQTLYGNLKLESGKT